MDSDKPVKRQIDKFREAARELETDDREERFDRLVKNIAKVPPAKDPQTKEG